MVYHGNMVTRHTLPILSPYMQGYIAGLFDGEGSIGIYRRRKKYPDGKELEEYGLRLFIYQRQRKVLDCLKMVTNCGSVFERRQSAGSWSRPGTTYWAWQVSDNAVAEVLKAIAPHVIVKVDQVDTAIEYQELKMEWDSKRRAAGWKGALSTPPEVMERYREMRQRIMDLNTGYRQNTMG